MRLALSNVYGKMAVLIGFMCKIVDSKGALAGLGEGEML